MTQPIIGFRKNSPRGPTPLKSSANTKNKSSKQRLSIGLHLQIFFTIFGCLFLQPAQSENILFIDNGVTTNLFYTGDYETIDQAQAACRGSLVGWPDKGATCDVYIGKSGFSSFSSKGTADAWWSAKDFLSGSFTVGQCGAPKKYNKVTGECGSDEMNGMPESEACFGDPINMITGNVFESDEDYSLNNSPLEFSRAYNSADGIWRTNYSTHLVILPEKVALVRNDGKTSFFSIEGSNISPDSFERGKLVRSGDEWSYTSTTNELFKFNSSGKLVEWINSNAKTVQLHYDAPYITVTDGSGRNIKFSQDDKFQPLTLETPSLSIAYNYDKSISTFPRLKSVVRNYKGMTLTKKYNYGNENNSLFLTSVIDERGIQRSSWTYDNKGRASLNEQYSGIGRISLYYNSISMTTALDSSGLSTMFFSIPVENSRRINMSATNETVNCPSAYKIYTYNSSGQILIKTDAQDNKTKYTYNDRGLEVQRIEATGTPLARTTTTEWDPERFLPVKIVTPTRTTLYTYDNQGRQLSQQSIAN